MRSRYSLAVVPLGVVCLGVAALAQPTLQYRSRGNRWEGVRSLPAAGYTIELVSARAQHEDPLPASGVVPAYRLLFFLERPGSASLVVREIENTYSYWLDKVTPSSPWQPGFNEFAWSTRDVIAPLGGPTLRQLGVTVRLDVDHPSEFERVAPGILYHTVAPAAVTGYEFVFKTNVTARLEFALSASDGTAVAVPPEPRVRSRWSYGAPLRVTWDATAAPAGRYRLTVSGTVLATNEKFSKTVEFFHQPHVR